MSVYRMGRRGAVALALLALLTGCQTRSISDSGYRDDGRYSANPLYLGELTAYDILGIDPRQPISDAEIRQAFTEKQPISVKRGASIMLVQSGAMIPDAEMVDALNRYYSVIVFSGVPQQNPRRLDPTVAQPAYSQLLRLAAAKGGFDKIVVYWGILESAWEALGTKAISWLPVLGGVIPDQAQHMRIRRMMAVIDTRTGQWETFLPKPFDDEAISNEHGRGASDQRQVALLKGEADAAAAESFVDRYGR